ncbi:hypothetical protein LY78DRAFT_46288 [Colletotrichum sublineola]|nr:hypothetical protein LY78DRAFT_46288 [Colletotrichum sublineola]
MFRDGKGGYWRPPYTHPSSANAGHTDLDSLVHGCPPAELLDTPFSLFLHDVVVPQQLLFFSSLDAHSPCAATPPRVLELAALDSTLPVVTPFKACLALWDRLSFLLSFLAGLSWRFRLRPQGVTSPSGVRHSITGPSATGAFLLFFPRVLLPSLCLCLRLKSKNQATNAI